MGLLSRRNVNYGEYDRAQHRIESDWKKTDEEERADIRKAARSARRIAEEHDTPQEEKKRRK